MRLEDTSSFFLIKTKHDHRKDMILSYNSIVINVIERISQIKSQSDILYHTAIGTNRTDS